MEVTEAGTDMILECLRVRGVIECTYRDHRPGKIDSCMIRPWAHDALPNLASADPSLRIWAQRILDPLTLRPCLFPEENVEPGWEWGRACINSNHGYLKFDRNKLEEKRRWCTVLMLGRFHDSAKDHHIEIANTEFINDVVSFVDLKCLSLRGISRITEIPSSVGNLGQLRILDLRACYDLERLPVELARLELLEHLDVSECYFLTHMPKGVESLTELRVLKGFVVGSPQRHDSCQLGELSALSKLQKLSIRVARDSVLEEEQLDKLKCLGSLVSLTITWSVSASASKHTADSTSSSSSSMALTVNEMDISPPPNLEKLDIRCIPHSMPPQWLNPGKLSKLKRLYIRAGNLNLQSLCAPGLTWDSVRVIRLRFVQGVNREDVLGGQLKAFPSLDYLQVHKCNVDSKFDYRWTSPRHEEELQRRHDEELQRRLRDVSWF